MAGAGLAAVIGIFLSLPVAAIQLAALDATGRGAVFHGRRMYSIHTHSVAQNCLTVGNIIANETVTKSMADAFGAAEDRNFADRLLRALDTGRDAGGEIIGPMRSASLRVTGEMGINHCDLRIDSPGTDAVGDLRALYREYQSQADLLRRVALEPNSVPNSRALFDASVARIRELDLVERFPSELKADSWRIQ